MLLYKYYIPEKAKVKKVSLRNVIIDRGEAEVHNHIPQGNIQGNIFYYPLLRNVLLILLNQTFTLGPPFT